MRQLFLVHFGFLLCLVVPVSDSSKMCNAESEKMTVQHPKHVTRYIGYG